MAVVYSIRDWDRHFEVAQSRKIEGPHSWVALPTKHDGKGFRRIMLRPDGPVIYGAWVLIVQIAAKCPKRGLLVDDDGPLGVDDMAIKTGCPPDVFRTALNVLCSKEIGWMNASEVVDDRERTGSALPLQDRTGQDKQDPTNQPPYPPAQTSPAPNADPQAGGLAGGKVFDLTWEVVAQRLASVGVVQWQQASQNAQANGCSPQLAHTLIDFAEQHSFGPGAIAKRFAIASPTLGINSGWPNTDRPETREEQRLVAAAKNRAKRAEVEREQQAWRMVKDGRANGKCDEEIKAEVEALGLPWPNPAAVPQKKAVTK